MDASAPANPPIAMTCQSFRSLAGAPKALPACHTANYESAASTFTGMEMPHKPNTPVTSRQAVGALQQLCRDRPAHSCALGTEHKSCSDRDTQSSEAIALRCGNP